MAENRRVLKSETDARGRRFELLPIVEAPRTAVPAGEDLYCRSYVNFYLANGAVIAPGARLDDGLLDLVVVAQRSLIRACLELPFVFTGTIDHLGGVAIQRTDSMEIASPYPLVYHIDGEPIAGTLKLSAKARPRALRLRVPQG